MTTATASSLAIGDLVTFDMFRGIAPDSFQRKPITGRLIAKVAAGTYFDPADEGDPNPDLWIIRIEGDVENMNYGELLSIACGRLSKMLD